MKFEYLFESKVNFTSYSIAYPSIESNIVIRNFNTDIAGGAVNISNFVSTVMLLEVFLYFYCVLEWNWGSTCMDKYDRASPLYDSPMH